MQLSVIIPVLNEEATIEKILAKVVSLKEVFEIIVVNDGSTDSSQAILDNLKKSAKFSKKLKILSHTQNLGKGSAIIQATYRAVVNDYPLVHQMSDGSPINE